MFRGPLSTIPMHSNTVCLAMIVRDEAPVIRRCLESLRWMIHHWVIVDTGSSDGTQEIIRETLADIPGELHERPWVNFGHNRTEALELARGKADYIFVIDADEVVEGQWPGAGGGLPGAGAPEPELTADAYLVEIRYGDVVYNRTQLLRADLDWRYVGVLHEYAHCPNARSAELLRGIAIRSYPEGIRSRDPHKYLRDALALEIAVRDEPSDPRYRFYLAQSYHSAGMLPQALQHYGARIQMGGWDEETWYAMYQSGIVNQKLGRWPEALAAYLEAYQFRPSRVESLFAIGLYYNQSQQFGLAHMFLSLAAAIPYPNDDRLFIERSMYEHRIKLELAVAAHYLGKLDQAVSLNDELLAAAGLPAEVRQLVQKNRAFSTGAVISGQGSVVSEAA
jgi:glycosyltransferase involved in cell wall biosynthesis